MDKKYDWRKQEKNIYGVNTKPQIITIPKRNYLTIKGIGNPNELDFANRIGALMTLSYGIRMMPRKGFTPEGYYEYGVYPLEGIWSLTEEGIQEKEVFHKLNKDQLSYTIMVCQPDFVTEEVVTRAFDIARKKGDSPLYQEVNFCALEEGLCAQILHYGSYDEEPETFRIMDKYLEDTGYRRTDKRHKEIYLSDARKTDPSRLKTILRYWIEEV